SVADEDARKVQRLRRAQWPRAAILGANDGLLSTTSLMLGVGAAKEDRRYMVLSGLAGAVAGACSMAVGEFVSVSTQKDIEKETVIQEDGKRSPEILREDDGEEVLTNPYKAAVASGVSFLIGSCVPSLSAVLVAQNVVRIVVIAVVASIALAFFGGFGAYLGGSPIRISAVRILLGGWIAMAITFGLLK
ncbi:hypothetical protein POPTR_011G146100v4, partial [Populus trichocarpa]